MVYHFLDLEFCPQTRELRRDGELLPLGSRAIDVLEHLIQHRDRVVSKRELLRDDWRGVPIEDDSVSQCVLQLRRACRQFKRERVVIETHCGHGYRFVADAYTTDRDSVGRAEPARLHRGSAHTGGAFVGRARELDQLSEALAAAAMGRGSCVFIEGEEGMGKTTLARELADRAAMQGIPTLWGHCHPDAGSPAYWPLGQVLRQWAESLPEPDATEQLAPLVRHLSGLLSESHPALVGVDLVQAASPSRLQVFQALGRALELASGGKGLIVVLDDLHWADPSSLAFFEHLCAELSRRHLLLVATIRKNAESSALSAARAAGARHDVVKCIELSGLDRDDSERLIRDTSYTKPHTMVVEAIHQQTGGVPLYLTEIVSLLMTDGRLEIESDSASWGLGVPPSIRHVIVDRVARIGKAGREALRLASVLGFSFDLASVRQIADDDTLPVLTALEDAADSGLIQDHDIDGYVFSHTLIREALYQTLDDDRQRALHLRAALRLIELDADEGSSEIAGHLLAALPLGGADRAIDYASRAGDEAKLLCGPERAAEFYGAALNVLDDALPAEEDRRLDLLIGLVQVTRLNALSLEKAQGLARRLGRSGEFVRALRKP